MSSIILANDMMLNNVTFNMSFDNLTFKSGGNRLIASNESYSIDDVVPEDTNFYVFNSSEDKQVLIADRSTSAKTEVPSSLWYEVDGYTDTSYAGIKLVKKDGFNVTAPTFDSVKYGYTSVSAKAISIYNRGTSDLQVKSVTVDEPSKFTVIGTTQPTIASKATDNTSFTIKPVDGLNAGTHTATITVTDMSDNAYTATVKFIVEKVDITPTVSVSDVEYGTPVNPTITGNTGSGTVEYHYIDLEDNDTTTKPTNAGNYKVYAIIGETTNYNGATTSQENFTISPKSITISVDTISDQTYTGTSITPDVVVKYGTTILTKGTDYEVTYTNNKNVGTATATISEVTNGNYTFSDLDVNFTIKKAQLKKVTLRTDTIVYNGSGSFPAMDNIDFNLQELSGTLGATNVGDYKTYVSLKDTANYEWVDGTIGKLTLNWKIIQATITDESVTLPQSTYKVTGSEIEPEPTVVVKGRTLEKDTDYTVAYANNTNAGTATITVTSKNNYKGTIQKTFEIVIDISRVTISEISNQTYTGESITPDIIVKDGDNKLIEGTDYEVEYSNNVNVGTATVTITGKGNYVGTINKTFNIVAKNLSTVTTTVDTSNKTYTGKELTTSVTIKDGTTVLKNGTDYTINYSNNKVAGKATVTITGKENYTGTITKYFYIVPKKVTGVTNKTQDTKSITVKWSKTTGATGYEVYKYDTSKKKYVKVKTTTNTSYKVTGLKAGTTYKFKVKAYKIVDGKKYYGVDSSVVKLTTKTSTPKISKVTAGKKTATVKWGKISGSSGYEVYVATRKNGKYTKKKTITSSNTLSYKITGLKSGKTYYIKIRTYRTVNGKKIYSSYSSIKSIRVK